MKNGSNIFKNYLLFITKDTKTHVFLPILHEIRCFNFKKQIFRNKNR